MQPHNRSLGFNILVLSLTFLAVTFLLLALLWPKAPASSNVSADLTQYIAKSVVLMTGVDIRTLPQADQEALAEGIPLQDATALAHLLEDYDA